MTFRQFIVPDEADILETLGVEPEPVADETTVRGLHFSVGRDELRFIYDVLGRAVTIQWSRDGAILIDMTRDGAALMRVEWKDRQGAVYVDFETEELDGSLAVQVYPTICIKDVMMFA